jgi:RNA polymerase sigma factor (sigma-70 family)
VQTLEMIIDTQDEDNGEAFAQVQALLEPGIRRFVRRLIGSDDAVDDIVQEVFISLYRNLHRIRPIENVRPYAYGIARKRCYTELRRRRRSREDLPDLDQIEMLPDNASRPDEITHLLLLTLEVRDAINKLPEMQRQTLILFCEEDLSYVEIAQIMHTTVGTVKSRLHYAKQSLRGLMKPATLNAIEGELGL